MSRDSMVLVRIAVVTLCLVICCAMPAAGADIHVATDGADTGAGTETDPFATIQHAINTAAAGDTILVGDGTYSGPGNRDLLLGGKQLQIRSLGDDPATCVIDCADSVAHVGFTITGDYSRTTVIRGFRITGAAGQGAIVIGYDPFFRAAPSVVNCDLVGNMNHGVYVSSLSSETNIPLFTDCRADSNGGWGMMALGNGIEALRCTAEGNGAGGFAVEPGNSQASLTECDARGNGGSGFRCVPSFGCVFINDCSAEDNQGDGVFGSAYDGNLTISGTRLERNTGHGFQCAESTAALVATLFDCDIIGNGSDGISASGDRTDLSLDTCRILDNGGKGVRLGRWLQSLRVSGCLVSGNLGSGIGAGDEGGEVYCHTWILDSTIVDNRGHGVDLFRYYGPREFSGLTVADNDSSGIRVFLTIEPITVSNCIAADNGGLGFEVDEGFTTMACAVSYGNAGGNWSATLDDAAEAGDIVVVDPMFCDPDAGDYTLAAASPCAEGNSGACVWIGAQGVGCAGIAEVPDGGDAPPAARIVGAFPNPFNPVTRLVYELPGRAVVDLRIYDVRGRLVRSLVVGDEQGPGRQSVVWRGRDDSGRVVATGVYLYRLQAGVFSDTKRVVLVK